MLCDPALSRSSELSRFDCNLWPQLRHTGWTACAGGHYSAYQDLPWINELAAWLRDAAQQYPGVKFAGICFGCQILARGEDA